MAIRMTAALVALVLAGDGGKIQWGKDHARALAEAKESGKPVVIFFSADW